MSLMKHAITVIAVALAAVACTPQQVADTLGVDHDTAVAISEWVNAQDCLPGYDADRYIECAIRDSWHRYDVPTSLDGWARIAWCESKLRPEATSPSGSYLGLFQQSHRYWHGRAQAAGYSGDPHNARVNAMVSGWLAETGGLGHWTCRP